MSTVRIPPGNWCLELALAIEEAAPGDTIIVLSEAMRAVALRAQQRVCPDKVLTVTVEPCEEGACKDA